METNQKAAVTGVSQQKSGEPQSESNAIGSKIKDNEKLSREDIKFIGELGWLGAAAVTIAAIAASV
jgi:uncharacterized coiled-coil DUF342 family protein